MRANAMFVPRAAIATLARCPRPAAVAARLLPRLSAIPACRSAVSSCALPVHHGQQLPQRGGRVVRIVFALLLRDACPERRHGWIVLRGTRRLDCVYSSSALAFIQVYYSHWLSQDFITQLLVVEFDIIRVS